MVTRSTEVITGVLVVGVISFFVYRFLWDAKEGEKMLVKGTEKGIKSYRDQAKEELIGLRSKMDTKVKLHVQWNYKDSKEGCTVKRFYFLRHGEAEHNKAKKTSTHECDCNNPNPSGDCPYFTLQTIDPMLTELGRKQARNLVPKTTQNKPPDVIYVSPLQRATETAILAFPHLYPATSSEKTKLPQWKCDERIRERNGKHPCDRRLAIQALARKFSGVNYHGLSDQDVEWDRNSRERRLDAAKRGYEFMLDVMRRPEKTVAVVSHCSFMGGLFMTALDCEDESLSDWFKTGELRAMTVSCSTASLKLASVK